MYCQNWAFRRTKQNPIKRYYYLKFDTRVKADFFLECWNDLLNKYAAFKHSSHTAVRSSNVLSTVSEDVASADSTFSSTTNVAHLEDSMATNLNLAETFVDDTTGDDFEEEEVEDYSYAQSYSDEDDLFNETQSTTDTLHFTKLQRK